jgi:hypothetical protein
VVDGGGCWRPQHFFLMFYLFTFFTFFTFCFFFVQLHFWGNEILNQTVMEMESHRAVVLPIVFNALYRNNDPKTAHWQSSIRDGAMFVLQRYESTDPDLYHQCVEKYNQTINSAKK